MRDQYNFFHWHLAFPEVFKPKPTDQIGDDELAGWSGGFDCVLGNPPWERIKLQEKEFFAARNPDIANAPNAAARRRLIEKLKETDPPLYRAFQDALRRADGESTLVRDTSRYPLCGRGDVNTYSIFAELKRSLLNPSGRVGCIVPSGIATDDTTKFFFQDLIATGSLVSLYDFENRNGIFSAVHRSYKFCLLTMRSPFHSPLATRHSPPADFVFFAHDVDDLAEQDRHFSLTAEDIALLNPNTRTCPIFRSKADAELTKAIYRRVPVLIKEARDGQPEENPWGVKFLRMFDMSNDSHLFRTREQLEAAGGRLEGNIFHVPEPGRLDGPDPIAPGTWLPLYEAKFIHHFQHRHASLEVLIDVGAASGIAAPSVAQNTLKNPLYVVHPRYWVAQSEVKREAAHCNWNGKWWLVWRDMARATDIRTVISAIIPESGVGGTAQIALTDADIDAITLVSVLNSFVLDFAARQKIGGTHVNLVPLKQFPCVSRDLDSPMMWFFPLYVLELTFTAWDLEPFARDCGYDGPPFTWDDKRRFLIRAELDAAFFHLYLPSTPDGDWKPACKADGAVVDETPEQLAELRKYFLTPRDAVAYIMETFPIVKRKDVEKYGCYRTKDTILEIYDEMQRVMRANSEWRTANGKAENEPGPHVYQTRLNPPPGPPADVAGNFIPMAKWDPAHWPAHIHRPREEATISRPAAAAPAVIVPGDEIDQDRLLEAFREVRQGMSPDYVVADPQANRRFQEAARLLGLRADPSRLNQALLNARKAGRLKDEPSASQYRLAREYEPYLFASEWSVRHLQRQLLKEINRMPALDELLCNPSWAERFDEIVARIKPGFAAIDYRWAALAMRKKGRNKPLEKAVEMPLQRQLTLGELFGSDLPADPGLYLIRCGERPLYLNWAENLADQVQRHREVAGEEMVPPWLLDGVGRANQLRYTALRGLRQRELQEMRITQVARLQPWLNLLEVGDAA
ncbi:MAG: hypothetical protein KatS3mg104_1165 [Phycisphaerae bacterium]|nr:MAG: hypothetical protein KatS3mg104_1165 [Phycisphaerae bacterium]